MRDSDWVSAILQNAIPLIFILFTYLDKRLGLHYTKKVPSNPKANSKFGKMRHK
jgi:hypothetical protein